MLIQLELNNFRRQEHLVLDFVDGLNVIRGQNEAGKSTTLEAIAYALYGTKALRSSLDDTVTYGVPVNKLKVALTLSANGRILTFTRSKGGAEVTCEGNVLVTGQAEVSNYAADVLGADLNRAAMLMFAKQGELRGTLDNGPTATGSLLETLADFDLFERLLNAATEKLTLGSSAALEQRHREQLDRLNSTVLPARPDEAVYGANMNRWRLSVDEINARITNELEPAMTAARSARDGEYEKLNEVRSLKRKLDTDTNALLSKTEQVKSYRAVLETPDPSEALAAAEREQANLDQLQITRRAYRKFQGIQLAQVERVSEEADVIADKVTAKQVTLRSLSSQRATTKGEIATAQARIISSSLCPTCGQDVAASAKVKEQNAEAEAEITRLTHTLNALDAEEQRVSSELDHLNQLIKVNGEYLRAIRGIEQYLTIDSSVTPISFDWAEDAPDLGDLPDYTSRIAELRAESRRRSDAAAKIDLLNGQIVEIEDEIAKVKAKIDSVGASEEEFVAADKKYDEALRALFNVRDEMVAVEKKMTALTDEYNSQLNAYNDAVSAKQLINIEIGRIAMEIDTLNFNNALVKKIRGARPIITTKLWNMVLSSVSTLFSRIRGTQSIVSRDEKGFLVDGQRVETLSGSTQDILGNAIRVALIKTFIPNCDLMILDEPSAGCDSSRTESLVGFLSSCGFNQVLMVTHEDISLSVANKVIQL